MIFINCCQIDEINSSFYFGWAVAPILDLCYLQQKSIQQITSAKMLHSWLAEAVVETYLNQHFLVDIDKAIQQSISQQKIQKNMPSIITNQMIIKFVHSAIKNNGEAERHQLGANYMKEIGLGNRKNKKFMFAKDKNKSCAVMKMQENVDSNVDSNADGEQSEQSGETQKQSSNIGLVKLPQIKQEDEDVIKEIRHLRDKILKFDKRVKLEGEVYAINRRAELLRKKKSHKDCVYHTYDYDSDIMGVQSDRKIGNCEENYQQATLLQKIKNNLDFQIQEEKIKEQQASNQNLSKITNKVGKPVKKEKQSKEQCQNNQQIQKTKKPAKFIDSKITSLVNNIESSLSEGIKLITNQQMIVERDDQPAINKFEVIKYKMIKQNKAKVNKKQKTQQSQMSSIIYSLQQDLRQCRNTPSNKYEPNSLNLQYKSEQLNRHNEDNMEEIYQQYQQKQKIYTIDLKNHSKVTKLPHINVHNKDQRPIKRTATEQKIVRGLSSISIATNSCKLKDQDTASNRLELYSALQLNKATESSLDQSKIDRHTVDLINSPTRGKKDYLKQYFGNYKQQFLHKLQHRAKVINLYN